jgi:hypothetical protein
MKGVAMSTHRQLSLQHRLNKCETSSAVAEKVPLWPVRNRTELPFESRSHVKGPISVGSRPRNRSGVWRFANKWATRLGIPLIGIALCGFLHAQTAVPTLVQHLATGMDLERNSHRFSHHQRSDWDRFRAGQRSERLRQ